MNLKKLCLVNDIISIRILLNDLNERLEKKISDLTQMELDDIIAEKIKGDMNEENL